MRRSKNKKYNIFINITLTSEEAKVFREAYERQIRENEERLENGEVDNPGKLMEETDKLVEELEVFNAWNP